MNFEKPRPASEEGVGEEGPDRFLRLLKRGLEMQFRKIEVFGKENLLKISPEEKVIVASTHISDYDVPLALAFVSAELGRDAVVGDASTHHKFRESPLEYVGNIIGGKKHFLPVETKKDKMGVEHGKFNPDNFPPMETALAEGKSVALSAYHDRKAGWKLPARGGVGAVYLAQLADAVILPVSIDVKSTEEAGRTDTGMRGRLRLVKEKPDASINIGQPIRLGRAKGLYRLAEIFEKRKRGEELSAADREEFKNITGELRKSSDIVMRNLAAMLPEEKRGRWAKNENHKEPL